MRKNCARNTIGKKLFDCFDIAFEVEFFKIGKFTATKKLYSLICKRIIKTRKRKSGPVDVGNGKSP